MAVDFLTLVLVHHAFTVSGAVHGSCGIGQHSSHDGHPRELSLLQTATQRHHFTVDLHSPVVKAHLSIVDVHSGAKINGPTTAFICISLSCAFSGLVAFAVLVWWQGRALRLAVQSGMEGSSTDLLGVELSVGSCSLNPWTGKMRIANISVSNPAGYKSRNLLRVDKAVVTLDMMKLACYFGKHIAVERLDLSGLVVTYEKKSSSHSNVQDVFNSVEKITKSLETKQAVLKRRASNPSNWSAGPEKAREPAELNAELVLPPSVILQEVRLQDITAVLAEESFKEGHEASLSVSIADIERTSFIDDVHETRWDEIARVLLRSLLKAVNDKAPSGLNNQHLCCGSGVLRAASLR